MNQALKEIKASIPDYGTDDSDEDFSLDRIMELSAMEEEAFGKAVAEKCAQLAEAYEYMSPNFTTLANEIRHLFGIIK